MNAADAACRDHDMSDDYDTWMGYFTTGKADRTLIKALEGEPGFVPWFAKNYFRLKGYMTPDISQFALKEIHHKQHDMPIRRKPIPVDDNGNEQPSVPKRPRIDPNNTPHVPNVPRQPPPANIPDDDMGAGTSEDTEPANRLAASSSSGGRMGGEETSVDQVRFEQLLPFRPTANAIMPYVKHAALAFGASTVMNGFAFRLNSIYDCLTGLAFTANPTPAADTADGSVERPYMYQWWTSIYRYWTVTRATYTVRIWSTHKKDDLEFSVWCYHNGQQAPPQTATSGARIPDSIRKYHKHCHMKRMHAIPTSTIEKTSGQNVVTFTGSYYPGSRSVHNEVEEDEYKETWHRVTEVPSLREVATFHVQKSDRCAAQSIAVPETGGLRYSIDIVYHVQWKDLDVIYQYPTQEDDIAVINNYLEDI